MFNQSCKFWVFHSASILVLFWVKHRFPCYSMLTAETNLNIPIPCKNRTVLVEYLALIPWIFPPWFAFYILLNLIFYQAYLWKHETCFYRINFILNVNLHEILNILDAHLLIPLAVFDSIFVNFGATFRFSPFCWRLAVLNNLN